MFMIEKPRYCCDICRIAINEGEFRYSINNFGKALCRNHQEVERMNKTPQEIKTQQDTASLEVPKRKSRTR